MMMMMMMKMIMMMMMMKERENENETKCDEKNSSDFYIINNFSSLRYSPSLRNSEPEVRKGILGGGSCRRSGGVAPCHWPRR